MNQLTEAEAREKICPLIQARTDNDLRSSHHQNSYCLASSCMAWEWDQHDFYYIIRRTLKVEGKIIGKSSIQDEVEQHNKQLPNHPWPSKGWVPWSTNSLTRARLEKGEVDLEQHRDWRVPIPQDQHRGKCNAFTIFRSVEMS